MLPVLFWARLFKINDVVSKRFVKFSEVNFSNMQIFIGEKISVYLVIKS